MLLKLDCWFKTIWRSITSFFKTGNITPIMGCVYTDHEVHRNCIVIVGKCEHCDDIDISWQKEGSITDKRLVEYYNTADSDNIKNLPDISEEKYNEETRKIIDDALEGKNLNYVDNIGQLKKELDSD